MSDEDMEQLLAAVEDRIGASWVEATEWLRDNNQLDEVAERVRANDFEGAVKGVEDAAVRVANSIQSAYVDSAAAAADFIDDIKPGRLVSFDSTNRRAAEWAASNRAELVREVTTETRRVVANIVSRGVAAGTNPRQVAIEIRDSIGLTEAQEQHVSNYRRALQDGDWDNALGRALRDKRSDKTLRRLLEDGGSLTQERIDRMVDRYRGNYVAHRAEVIARTEGLRALHEGTDEMYQQAIDDGTMAADELMQEWHSAADGRVRDSHTHVVDAETGELTKPIGVGYWRTRDGNLLRYPGDPTAPAADIIQCRCVVSTIVNPNVLPTGDAPAGFADMGRQVRVGIPKADDIRPNAVYRVPIGDIRSKLYAPPGVDDAPQQTQSIREAWADGRKLQPTKVLINGDGTYYVVDGRHRLQAAMEQDRDVLIEFGIGMDASPSAAVRLKPTPPVAASSPTTKPRTPGQRLQDRERRFDAINERNKLLVVSPNDPRSEVDPVARAKAQAAFDRESQADRDRARGHEADIPKQNRAYASREITSSRPLSEKDKGANVAEVATLDDGSKAIFKPAAGEEYGLAENVPAGTYYIREAAASNVADAIGVGDLVPRTVIHNRGGNIGALQDWVDGTTMVDVTGPVKFGRHDAERMRVYDYVIGNADRHDGNLLVREVNGKQVPVLIDHGLAFPQTDIGTFVMPNRGIDDGVEGLLSVTHDQIRSLDVKHLAKVMRASALDRDAAHSTIVRTLNLKRNPALVAMDGKAAGYADGFEDGALDGYKLAHIGSMENSYPKDLWAEAEAILEEVYGP